MNGNIVANLNSGQFSDMDACSEEQPIVITLSDENIPEEEEFDHTNDTDSQLQYVEGVDMNQQSSQVHCNVSHLYDAAMRVTVNDAVLVPMNGGGAASSTDMMNANLNSSQENIKFSKSFVKRKELSIPEKIEVIRASETGLSQRQVAKKFGISKTQVHCLIKRKSEIFKYFELRPESWRKRKSKRFNNDDINDGVWKWFVSKKSENVSVSGTMLQEKALQISKDLEKPDFKASNGWLDNFKKRHDIGFSKKPDSIIDTNSTFENHTEVEETKPTKPIMTSSTQNYYNPPPLLRAMPPRPRSIQHEMPPRPIPHEPENPCFPMPPAPRTLSEAMRLASQLKSFSVGTGNVILIGLTCALENELRRDLDNMNFMAQGQKPRCDYDEFPSMVRP